MRFARGVAIATASVAICIIDRPAEGWMIKSFSAAELTDFAAQSTAVVRAKFLRWERKADGAAGRRDDDSFGVPEIYNHDALARFKVEQVVGGDGTLTNKEIVIVDTSLGGMESLDDKLLFLRREGDRFSQVHWGGFVVKGSLVQVHIGAKSEVPWNEVAALVRTVNLVHVTWTGTVAPSATRGTTLHIAFTAKNEGKADTQVLAPSHCQSVKAYPLASDGRWHASKSNWFEVPSAWLTALDEPATTLAVGASHPFQYDIPLTALKMDATDSYDVVLGMTDSFCTGLPSDSPTAAHLHGNTMASQVTRVALSGPRAIVSVDAGPGPIDAGPTSADADIPALPVPIGPPRPESSCRGGCALPRNTSSSPGALALTAVAMLALARRRSRTTVA